MKIFCLHGQANDKIYLELNEVLGFPKSTSYEGGYDIICTLRIDAGGYHIYSERYFSATGALYTFANHLQNCYKNLEGQANYSMQLENDLSLTITMTSLGHAIVNGRFQERPDRNNIFLFEIETDQSCILKIIQEINELKEVYGDMEGIK